MAGHGSADVERGHMRVGIRAVAPGLLIERGKDPTMKIPPRSKIPAFASLALVLALIVTPAATAAEFTSQYFRWRPTKLRNSTNELQISEFKFMLGTTAVPWSTATVTTTGGGVFANEGVANIKDLSTNTKWFTRYTVASTPAVVVFSFPAPVTVDKYSFATANDFDARDPVSWVLETGTSASGPWAPIDVRTNYPTTIDRFTWVEELTIPLELPPEIVSFTAFPSVVTNGQPVELAWNVGGATTFEVTPEPGVVEDFFTTVTPAANADTEYILDATNTAATVTARQTVRAVAGGASTYRYVRFTPLKVRSTTGGTAIQMDDLIFYANGSDADSGNDIQILPAAVRTQTGLYTEAAAEGPNKLKDANIATKWYSATLQPVIFDLGSQQTFDTYRITTGNDAQERDPVRWLLEGADDDTASTVWTRIDDLSLFDYSTPAQRDEVFSVPLPGDSLPPLSTFTADAIKVIAGEPLTFTWTSDSAAEVTIDPGLGAVALSGSTTIYPTASTTYTMTAISPAGFETVKTFPVTVVESAVTEIAYGDFDGENGELSLVGWATILNDSANIPLPGNAERLRLTPDVTGRNGAAWFGKRVPVSQGFDTTFFFHLNKPLNTQIGADGLSFVVQDSPLGNGALPDEKGLAARALAVQIDSYFISSEGDPSAASVRVRNGATTVAGSTVNLVNYPGITINTAITPPTLTSGYSAAPHKVRVSYVPGALNVWFDDVKIITDLSVDLSLIGAVNAEGKAWVGFGARTGGISQNTDITSWFMSTGSPSGPLVIKSYFFNVATGQGTLTWNSAPGKTYRITSSAGLGSFPSVLATGIVSGGALTSANFSFPTSSRTFFRVEETP